MNFPAIAMFFVSAIAFAVGGIAVGVALVYWSKWKAEVARRTYPIYRHFKGGRYERVFDVATQEATKASVVVYRSLEDSRVWVRDQSSWQEVVEWPDGALRARFVLEKDLPA